MTDYKHGDWYCNSENEEEAKEIVLRAIASGAVSLRDWGFNSTGYGVNGGVVTSLKFAHATKYTIDELRQKFPLPGEQEVKQWRGPEDGLPPVGVECEMLFDGEWISAKLIGFDEESPIVKMQIKRDLCTEIVYRACYNCKYRPLRTEREKVLDLLAQIVAEEADVDNAHAEKAASALYDAMQSGKLKAPTNEPG